MARISTAPSDRRALAPSRCAASPWTWKRSHLVGSGRKVYRRPRVESLAELMNRRITPEEARVNRPTIRRLDSALLGTRAEPAYVFEDAVFNFLRDQKESLGIEAVSKCANLRIDGILDLDNGDRLVLEVKYRMNWHKACQANWQFSWFLKRPEAKTRPIRGCLVVFEEFDGHGWQRRPASRLLENGWNYWYTEHSEVDGFPAHLARFRHGALERYDEALAAAHAAAGAFVPGASRNVS
jgi:hypothetical protein